MRKTSLTRLSVAACLLLCAAGGWPADQVRTPHVEVRLAAEQSQVSPGETLWLGLRFDLIPHWHIYWRNPGDSGEAPRVSWRLPAGWQAGEIHWPVPRRIPVGPLTNYGYEDTVTLLVPIVVPEPATAYGPVGIGATVSWLVCREECIPESANLTLDLDVAAGSEPASVTPVSDFAPTRRRLPLPFTGVAHYQPLDDARLQLRLRNVRWPADRINELWFAAEAWGAVAASGTQTWTAHGDDILLQVPTGESPPAPGAPLRGLLVLSERTGDGPLTRGFEIDAAPGLADRADPATGPITLAGALGLALVAGLLLNLMPCVLPVLSIKVLGLVRHSGGHSAWHGVVFFAGVLATFAALAGLLIGLRAGGAALGWGFQLQEPLVVIVLLYLMLAIALNLSGVYALRGGASGLGQALTARPGLVGTFATGALAVVVASPCTAPFMGAALGFALTRPPSEALLVFAVLGVGFALPVLVLSIWPRWARRLPPPGAWMERLRNALAFPMYGAAAWLLWVLGQQVAAPALAATLAGAVLLAFALWWYGQTLVHRGWQRVVVGAGLTLSVVLAALTALDPGPGTNGLPDAQSWSAERVRALQRQGRPVLVNFTAAWCITCKVNEQVALGTAEVNEALATHRVAYLKADWTRRDAAISAELERHGRSGVPLYLLFPAGGGAPQVLPQLLTASLVRQAIENL